MGFLTPMSPNACSPRASTTLDRNRQDRESELTWDTRMMLYGSVTMGSCYLVASLCLKTAENDPSRERIVS